MKKYIFIVLFTCICFAADAQISIVKTEKKLLDSVALRISLKTYILIENDTFIVFTPGKYFMEPFETWVKEHPKLIDDKKLCKAIKNDTARRMVHANKIAEIYDLTPRIQIQIANCLKIGKCLIYNKITEQLEKKVTIDDYLIDRHGEINCSVNGSPLFIIVEN